MHWNRKITTKKSQWSKIWPLEDIDKIDEPIATLLEKKREKTQTASIRNKREDSTTDPTDIKMI